MIFSLPQSKDWGNSRVVVMSDLRLGIRQYIYFNKPYSSPSGETCLPKVGLSAVRPGGRGLRCLVQFFQVRILAKNRKF